MGKARYDEVADSYASGPDDLSNPATEGLLGLAGEVSGLRVLDVACGHGLVARAMAARGAVVTGIDLSAGLLERARSIEAVERRGIEYGQADATDPGALAGQRFDLIVSNFGLSDIDDLAGLARNIARLLKPGGSFVFSILHPCFPGATNVSASWPDDGRYYDEGWWLAGRELSVLRRVVGANHRTLATYVNVLTDAGMGVAEVREPEPDDGWAISRPGTGGLPVYLVSRWVRAGSAIVLRPGGRADSDLLTSIEAHSALIAFAHIFDSAPYPWDHVQARWATYGGTIAIAEINTVPVGFAASTDAELDALFVLPQHWNEGVGGALLGANDGVRHLWTLRDNHHARAWYERRGWRPDGTEQVVYGSAIELGYTR